MENSKRPVLYKQAAKDLLTQIQTGVWAVGDNLPSESQLCEMLKVSRQTIRHALQHLQEAGYIHRQQGAATRVISTSSPRKFSQSFNSLGEILNYPRNTYRKNHIEEYVECDVALQKLLDAPIGSAWYHIGAVRLEEESDLRLAWTDIYILQQFAKLTQNKNHGQHMVYAQIEEEYGVSMAKADVEIYASTFSKYHAELLGVEVGSPCLVVVRKYYDKDGQPFEVTVTQHPEHRYTFKMSLRSSNIENN
jgi:DNA-binding GntR family transcriptional regulator